MSSARAYASGVLAAVLALTACDARPRYHIDGGLPNDAAPVADALSPADAAEDIFAGMTIGGCAEQSLTAETMTCRGTVPLALEFSSLAPTNTSTFIWEFGDDSADVQTASATHVYTEPGLYVVVLVVGGPFGSLSPPYLTQVEAEPAEVGGYCTADTQCADGLCLCATADATGCPPVLQGTCAAACPGCAPQTHCADLTVVAPSTAPAWRDEVCLPDCVDDEDCERPGFRCRELPSVDLALGRLWEPTCFPDVLQDVGAGCHDASDLAAPDRCLSGHCATLGRFGLCTDPCADTPCPSYATCVSFSGGAHAGEPLCVARCSPQRPCTADPQLACEPPNGAGELGFTLLDPTEPTGHTYCAPRRCQASGDCVSASCDLAAGGFCR